MSPVGSWGHSLPLSWEMGAVVPGPIVAGTDLGEHEGGSSLAWSSLAQSSLAHGGACCLDLPAAHKGTLLASAHDSSQMATPFTLLRSQRLEEEQQAALAALSEQLEAITSVEELTKLVSNCVLGQTFAGMDLVLGLTLLLSWVLPPCSCGQRVSMRSAS